MDLCLYDTLRVCEAAAASYRTVVKSHVDHQNVLVSWFPQNPAQNPESNFTTQIERFVKMSHDVPSFEDSLHHKHQVRFPYQNTTSCFRLQVFTMQRLSVLCWGNEMTPLKKH